MGGISKARQGGNSKEQAPTHDATPIQVLSKYSTTIMYHYYHPAGFPNHDNDPFSTHHGHAAYAMLPLLLSRRPITFPWCKPAWWQSRSTVCSPRFLPDAGKRFGWLHYIMSWGEQRFDTSIGKAMDACGVHGLV